MNLAIISEALITGGAETFVLRLASALQNRGVSVSIIVLRADLINYDICKSLSPSTLILSVHVPFLRVALKLDGFFYRCGLNISIVRWWQVKGLITHLINSNINLVHSNLLSADLVTGRACKIIGNLPWVTTMHGDYLAFEEKGKNPAARIINLKSASKEVEQSVNHLISITDQQRQQLNQIMPIAAAESRISKVYNGYENNHFNSSFLKLPSHLINIPKDHFVIGMVSRGIRDKGWDVMVNAFQALDFENVWLVLVGDGEYIQELKKINTNPRVIFTGNVSDPLRYIEFFDVACLPSRIPTESLPTVVIEYLILGKPVIATDVGEVAKMIKTESGDQAGILISLSSVDKMSQQMISALTLLYLDSNERRRISSLCLSAAKKFDMDLCVNSYLEIYKAAVR